MLESRDALQRAVFKYFAGQRLEYFHSGLLIILSSNQDTPLSAPYAIRGRQLWWIPNLGSREGETSPDRFSHPGTAPK